MPISAPSLARRLLIVLACAGSAAVALPPPLPPAQPLRPESSDIETTRGVLKFERTDADLGTFLDIDEIRGSFKFQNVGEEPVEILELKPSCGCTVATLPKRVFAPGESGEIPFTFDPKGRSGPQQKTIAVRTNSRVTRTVTLNVKSLIRPIVAAEPGVLTFGSVFKGADAVQLVRVVGRTSDFEASNPTVDNASMASVRVVETKPFERDGEQLRETVLEVTLSKDLKPGLHSTAMYVRTNDDRRPLLTVNIIAQVNGDLQIEPARLSLGLVRVGQPFDREILLRHRSGQAFQITGASFDSTALPLTITPEPVDPAKRDEWVLRISGTGKELAPRVMSQISVQTDIVGEETISIPLAASVRP